MLNNMFLINGDLIPQALRISYLKIAVYIFIE